MRVARPIASRRFSSIEKPAMRFIQFRSAPAENDLPAPDRTIARIPSSASIERRASVISAISTSSNALWRSGRFMVMSPRGPCRSMARDSLTRFPLHAEDAEARLFDGRIQGCSESEAEDPARVGRVDDAVVPEPRRRIVRMALPLVLLADRILERILVRLRPLLAFRLEAVAPNGREHRGRLLPAHHRDPGIGPGPEEARIERAPAHAVVSRAERA